jgi:hypothetical protein
MKRPFTLRTVFRRQPSIEHRAGQALDIGSLDRLDPSRAHGGRDMDAMHRLAVEAI